MKPGETTWFRASITRVPCSGVSEIVSMRPARMPTSRTASSFDSGSMTRPLAMTRSCAGAGGGGGEQAANATPPHTTSARLTERVHTLKTPLPLCRPTSFVKPADLSSELREEFIDLQPAFRQPVVESRLTEGIDNVTVLFE